MKDTGHGHCNQWVWWIDDHIMDQAGSVRLKPPGREGPQCTEVKQIIRQFDANPFGFWGTRFWDRQTHVLMSLGVKNYWGNCYGCHNMYSIWVITMVIMDIKNGGYSIVTRLTVRLPASLDQSTQWLLWHKGFRPDLWWMEWLSALIEWVAAPVKSPSEEADRSAVGMDDMPIFGWVFAVLHFNLLESCRSSSLCGKNM